MPPSSAISGITFSASPARSTVSDTTISASGSARRAGIVSSACPMPSAAGTGSTQACG